MTPVVRGRRRGVPVVRLVGEVGADSAPLVADALASALRSAGGRVVLDLRSAAHLHYRVAGVVVGASRGGSGLGIVGATPYVRQILRFAGALDGDPREFRNLGEALEAAVA